MRKHVDKNAHLEPVDHVNTRLSSGIGVVVETMMARNRDNRYRNPDDLILDLKCLLQGESPMIASGKADALAGLAEGDVSDDEVTGSPVAEAERLEMAGYVNNRNTIIAALAAFLGLSVLTNVLLCVHQVSVGSSSKQKPGGDAARSPGFWPALRTSCSVRVSSC